MTAPRPSACTTGRSTRRGFALLVVLLVVLLLEALVADLALVSWLALKEARNAVHDVQNRAAADGVLRLVGQILAAQDMEPEQRATLLREGITGLELGDTRVDAALLDESGKFNLNLLADPKKETADAAREEFLSLMNLLGVDAALAGRMADFAAANRPTAGASAKRRRMIVAIDELRQVQGVTDELLFGAPGPGPSAPAGAAPPGVELPPGIDLPPGVGAQPISLSQYLTCWGPGAVNVNTAPPEVLQALFGAARATMAEAVIAQREEKPLTTAAEITGFSTLPPPEQKRLTTRLSTASNVCSVTVTARSGDLTTVTTAVVMAGAGGKHQVLLCRRTR